MNQVMTPNTKTTISVFEHKGKKIIFSDYTQCKSQSEMIESLFESKEIMLSDPEIKLSLVDSTNAPIGREYMYELKKLIKEVIDKRIDKTAVIGVTGIKKLLFKAVASVVKNGNVPRACETKEEAIDFLVN